MNKLYAYISFTARKDGLRELLDCDLFTTEEEAKEHMNQYASNIIKVYSLSHPTKESPIRSAHGEHWYDIDIPGECSENGKPRWISCEIREVPLPA